MPKITRRDHRDREERRLVRLALGVHIVGSFVVLALVVIGAVLIATRIADKAAVESVEKQARQLADTYLAPLRDDNLRIDDRAMHAAMASAFRPYLRDGTIRHVKVWVPGPDNTGRIVFSERPELIGTIDTGSETKILGTENSHVEQVRAGDYGNVQSGLYEVYMGFFDADDQPFVFEAYLPAPDTDAVSRNLLKQWLGLIVGSVLLMALATLALSIRLARQVAGAHRERDQLAKRALNASRIERQRLAQRLHDGVIQDLSGVGLTLDSLGERSGARENRLLQKSAQLIRRDVDELRAVSEELIPDSLAGSRFNDAVETLRQSVDPENLQLSVRIDPGVNLDENSATLCYQVISEGVRNIERHAQAESAQIEVTPAEGGVRVRVVDDGLGHAWRPSSDRSGGGHIGLQLMWLAVTETGGDLQLTALDHGGSALTAFVPTP